MTLFEGRVLWIQLNTDRARRIHDRSDRATRVEPTAARWVAGIGYVAGERRRSPRNPDLRDRADQRGRVWMIWPTEQGFRLRIFDDAPEVHHGGAIAHEAHRREVMGNEQI